jgi:transposase
MGAFYRRMKARLGAPQAITAAAHRLARVIYALLRDGAQYVDIGQQAYEEQFQKRRRKNLERLAHQMGLQLIPAAPAT